MPELKFTSSGFCLPERIPKGMTTEPAPLWEVSVASRSMVAGVGRLPLPLQEPSVFSAPKSVYLDFLSV